MITSGKRTFACEGKYYRIFTVMQHTYDQVLVASFVKYNNQGVHRTLERLVKKTFKQVYRLNLIIT